MQGNITGDALIAVRDPGDGQNMFNYFQIAMSEIIESKRVLDVVVYDKKTDGLQIIPIETSQISKSNTQLIMLTVNIEDGRQKSIKLSPDHMVLTKNRGYDRADQITEEDTLIILPSDSVLTPDLPKTVSGKLSSIQSVPNEETYSIRTLFPFQNLFVNSIAVHN